MSRENLKTCEICGKPAKYIAGMVSETNPDTDRRFCHSCAEDFERLHFGDSGLTIASMFDTLILEKLNSQIEEQQAAVCPKCANTAENVLESGMVGCSVCYMVFKKEIENVIRELHGTKFG